MTSDAAPTVDVHDHATRPTEQPRAGDVHDHSAGPSVLRRSDHVRQPWKNGGGVTFEVARDADDAADFGWRLSFAEVTTPGPFSPFPGVDRVITLVEGNPMTLRVTPTGPSSAPQPETPFEQVLHPGRPFAFAGADLVDAAPNGPTLDFNVMVARGRFTAQVEPIASEEAIPAPQPSALHIVVCLTGTVTLDAESSVMLAPLDVAFIRDATRVRLTGLALLVHLDRA